MPDSVPYHAQPFVPFAEELASIQRSNELHEGKLITFFSLRGALNKSDVDLSRLILEAIVNVVAVRSAAQLAQERAAAQHQLQPASVSSIASAATVVSRRSRRESVKHTVENPMMLDSGQVCCHGCYSSRQSGE